MFYYVDLFGMVYMNSLKIGETYPVLLLSTVVNLPTVPLSVFPTMGPHPKNDVPNTLTRREQH